MNKICNPVNLHTLCGNKIHYFDVYTKQVNFLGIKDKPFRTIRNTLITNQFTYAFQLKNSLEDNS